MKKKRHCGIAEIGMPLLVAAMAFNLTSCSRTSAGAAEPTPPEVEVAAVEQKDIPVYREWIGTLDGQVNAAIRSQVTGYLLTQDYKEGSFVKKGQLLFEIDPRPLQAVVNQAKGDLAKSESQVQQAISQLDQAQAQLAQANSQLMQAEANQRKTQLDVNKYRPLLEQKAVTQQDYDNAVQANAAALAQVQVAKGQIKGAAAAVSTAKAAVVAAKAQVESSQAT